MVNFDKLNKLDIKYSSILYSFNDIEKINYLKEFNIDFSKIKKMTLVQDEKYETKDNGIYKTFLETLFSFNNIENNLVYLKIQFSP